MVPEERAQARAVETEGNEGGLFWMILCIRGRAARAVPSTTSTTTTPSSFLSLCKDQVSDSEVSTRVYEGRVLEFEVLTCKQLSLSSLAKEPSGV